MLLVNQKVFAYQKKRGFSLVELIIVIAIFAVLSAFAIPSYTQMVQNNRIKTAVESVQNGLQVARAEAVKRNAPVQFDLRGSDSAWTVCVVPAVPGACPNPDNANTIQSRSVGEGSSADIDVVTSNAGPFVFNGLGTLTSPAAAASGLISIDVDNSAMTVSDSRELRIVLGAGGTIKTCDPALSTTGTDPRRCPA